MKLLLLALAAVVVVAVVTIVGATLPREHRASRTLTTKRTPEELWAVVSDRAFAKAAAGDVDVDVVESVRPSRYVTRIADPNQPFGGTWTHLITQVPGGSTLTITEDGWVSNVVFRFVSRFVLGHHMTMDKYLSAVAQKFGETPQISGS